MTFEIDHIWKNGEEVANYSTILVPGDTIIIEYTATAASSGEEWPDVYIKIASGDSSEYYLASLPALGSGQTKSSGSITIDSFPTLYSDTHEVTFSYAISVENAENEDNAITDQGDPLKTFTNYVYPLSVIDNASKIVRCANDYTESISGTKALVQRLALFLQSGNLSDITSMELQIMKSTDDEDYDAGIIDISNYKSTIFEDGYSDSVQDSLFLLDSLNNSNFFKDYRYSYNFNIVFNYNSIGTSRSETYSITPLDYTLTGLTLTQAHAALQLVGQTELGTGEFVYGGVAIGQDPTIKQIGEPALECGYPSYFNKNVYINGIKYGYYPGDTFEINTYSYSVMGYLTSSGKNLHFTFYVGQPIYATGFYLDTTGDNWRVVRRAAGGYLTSNEYKNPYKMPSNTTNTIANAKAGIITVFVKLASAAKSKNNYPIIMNPYQSSKMVFVFT